MSMAAKTLHRNEKLKKWLQRGGVPFRDLLVEYADTKLCMIRQWTTGRRKPSAALAGDLVEAMERIKAEFPEAPAPLNRGDLCEACARCPHFKDAQLEVDDLK